MGKNILFPLLPLFFFDRLHSFSTFQPQSTDQGLGKMRVRLLRSRFSKVCTNQCKLRTRPPRRRPSRNFACRRPASVRKSLALGRRLQQFEMETQISLSQISADVMIPFLDRISCAVFALHRDNNKKKEISYVSLSNGNKLK